MEFVLAALLIGVGTRLIWTSACQLTEEEQESSPALSTGDGETPRIDPENWPDASKVSQMPSIARLP